MWVITSSPSHALAPSIPLLLPILLLPPIPLPLPVPFLLPIPLPLPVPLLLPIHLPLPIFLLLPISCSFLCPAPSHGPRPCGSVGEPRQTSSGTSCTGLELSTEDHGPSENFIHREITNLNL